MTLVPLPAFVTVEPARWRHVAIVCVCVGWSIMACADDTASMLDGLRARKLDQLFGHYCKMRLAEPDLDPGLRAQIGVAYAFQLVAQAGATSDSNLRDRQWNEAREQLVRLSDSIAEPTQKQWLQLQTATLDLAQGRWWRQMAELGGRQEATSEARRRLELARGLLDNIHSELASPAARRLPAKGSVGETLLSDVRERLALVEFELAQTFSARDAQFKRHLQSVVDRLTPIVTGATLVKSTKPAAPTAGAWEAALTLIASCRLLGQFDLSKSLLDRLESWPLTPDQSDDLVAERAELSLAQRQPLAALALLDPLVSARANPPPRWQFIYVRILLEQARGMNADEEKAGKLQAAALLRMRTLERDHPGLWPRRAELLLNEFASELVGLAATGRQRAAENLASAGRWSEAGGVYRQAAADALAQKREQDAITLLYESGRACERAGEHRRAADTFAEIGERWPKHPRAPEALHRAVFNLRDGYRKQRSTETWQRLRELLVVHHNSYPKDESAADILFLLGDVQRADGKWEEAIDRFLSIDARHANRPRAVVEASRTFEAWAPPMTEELSRASPSEQSPFARAVAFHDQVLSGADAAQLTDSQRAELRTRYARYLLDVRSGQPDRAGELLLSVVTNSKLVAHESFAARRNLAIAHLHHDRVKEAEQALEPFLAAATVELLSTFRLLNQVGLTSTEWTRRSIGRLELPLAAVLERRRDKLPPEEIADVDIALALAAVNGGYQASLMQSLARLDALVAKHPRDARFQEARALVLQELGRFDDAIVAWKSLITGLRKESPMWFRAHLNQVICLRRAGRLKEAQKQISLLEVLYPELGGPLLRARFEEESRRLIKQ